MSSWIHLTSTRNAFLERITCNKCITHKGLHLVLVVRWWGWRNTVKQRRAKSSSGWIQPHSCSQVADEMCLGQTRHPWVLFRSDYYLPLISSFFLAWIAFARSTSSSLQRRHIALHVSNLRPKPVLGDSIGTMLYQIVSYWTLII